MNEVTEEQKLFYNYATERFRTETDANYTLCLSLDEYKQALTEDRKEIRDKINERVKQLEHLQIHSATQYKDIYRNIIRELTELLTFIKEK